MIYNYLYVMILLAFLFYVSCSKESKSSDEIGSVTDIDGNVYQTVTIGTQIWMAENLKVTHYSNGEVIPNVKDSNVWKNLTTGAYCYYNNDTSYVEPYGRLYNWYVVNDNRNISPEGWHVPTDDEWLVLLSYLGGRPIDGRKLKEAGTEHWDLNTDKTATNESGFTALPSGNRSSKGSFFNIGYSTYFWSATEHSKSSVSCWYLIGHSSVLGWEESGKHLGFCIRCVRD